MNLAALENICKSKNIDCRKNEPLSGHCTFAVGGPAALFIEAADESEAAEVLSAANELGVKLFLLGNGSNVLFSDEGFNGAVLHIGKGFSKIRLADDLTIECESGASIKKLTEFACENSLTGLEFAYGIPGSVGGGIYMNAGAYDAEMKNVLVETHHLNQAGKAGSFSGDAMDLSYRHSAYTDSGILITRGIFRLQRGDQAGIRAKMDDFMQRRRDKQPLDLPSAGSTFRRPVGGYAGALIEQCGLKGRRVGGAMVNEKHAGFVVNTGGATCEDILNLIDIIKREVKEKTGFELNCEVKIIKA